MYINVMYNYSEDWGSVCWEVLVSEGYSCQVAHVLGSTGSTEGLLDLLEMVFQCLYSVVWKWLSSMALAQ